MGDMRGNKLTALKVNSLKKPGRYCDGLGLWLQVSDSGKHWLFRYMRHGRARQMGLGPLHTVNLAEARVRARQARMLLLEGFDPIDVKHETSAAARIAAAKDKTFAECANEFLRVKLDGFKNDKHRAQWRSTLEAYAFPVIGNISVAKIDTPLVLKVLRPIWDRAPETASRLRGRIERVLAWATVQEYRAGENPARWRGHLQEMFAAKPKAKHHAALAHAALPAFMAELRQRDSLSARALEFAILTAARTGETIGARWAEIDLEAKVWAIPAERMKAGREHRVPLSQRAVEILKALPRNGGGFVFAHPKAPGAISNMAMLELLRGMKGNGYTVHGFRSTFRDWCGERTNYPRELIEFALAHKLPDKVEAAYRRDTAVEKRRRLMTEWARYCEMSAATSEVRALHG